MVRPSSTVLVAALAVAAAFSVSPAASQPEHARGLAATLQLAGERVEHYFARAQSLVSVETVVLQPLDFGLSASGRSRTVESELRLSWDPDADTSAPLEATTVRQLLTVNGRPPRENDYDSCTTPERRTTETQPLSMLLASQRADYVFTAAGTSRQDGRPAFVVNFRMPSRPTGEVTHVEDKDDCVSFRIDGGTRGRVWIDTETHDVLRLDRGLTGLVDLRLPWSVARRAPDRAVWTVERMDSSIRFSPVRFNDPDEMLVLPVSASSLRVTRGAGTPRLRTTTTYSGYRRFLTGGRVVPPS